MELDEELFAELFGFKFDPVAPKLMFMFIFMDDRLFALVACTGANIPIVPGPIPNMFIFDPLTPGTGTGTVMPNGFMSPSGDMSGLRGGGLTASTFALVVDWTGKAAIAARGPTPTPTPIGRGRERLPTFIGTAIAGSGSGRRPPPTFEPEEGLFNGFETFTDDVDELTVELLAFGSMNLLKLLPNAIIFASFALALVQSPTGTGNGMNGFGSKFMLNGGGRPAIVGEIEARLAAVPEEEGLEEAEVARALFGAVLAVVVAAVLALLLFLLLDVESLSFDLFCFCVLFSVACVIVVDVAVGFAIGGSCNIRLLLSFDRPDCAELGRELSRDGRLLAGSGGGKSPPKSAREE